MERKPHPVNIAFAAFMAIAALGAWAQWVAA